MNTTISISGASTSSLRALRRFGLWAFAFVALGFLPSPGAAQFEVRNCQLVWTGPVRTETRCYTESNLRPVTVLTTCRQGLEKDGALCYPQCRAGYNGVGPVCWQVCPAGYADDGALCRRNAMIIGANNSACPWYDKCGLTFARGCSQCPFGYANDGCTCRIDVHIFAKDTYGRGVGESLQCAAGQERIVALCYKACPSGFHATGITCTANQQTCMEVPVAEPAPTTPFYFKESQGIYCSTRKLYADTQANADALARCACSNCAIESIDERDFSTACSQGAASQ